MNISLRNNIVSFEQKALTYSSYSGYFHLKEQSDLNSTVFAGNIELEILLGRLCGSFIFGTFIVVRKTNKVISSYSLRYLISIYNTQYSDCSV